MEGNRVNKLYSLLLCVIASLFISLGFFIGYLSYQKQIKEEQQNLFYLISKPYFETIETAINYGKPLGEFYGIDNIMKKNKAQSKDILAISMATPNGIILYSTESQQEGKVLGGKTSIDTKWRTEKYALSKQEDCYELRIAIKNQKEEVAIYAVAINKSAIEEQLTLFLSTNLVCLIMTLLVSNMILLFWMKRLIKVFKKEEINLSHIEKFIKKEVLGSLIAVIIVAQLLGQVPLILLYQENLKESTEHMCYELERSISQQVGAVIEEKHINFNELVSQYHLQEWVGAYVEEFDEISKLSIEEDKKSEWGFRVNSRVSESYINKQQLNVLGDVLTMFFIGLFVLLEMSQLVVNHFKGKEEQFASKTEGKIHKNRHMLSLLSFGLSAVCYLPIAFIPMIVTSMKGAESMTLCSLAIGIYFLGNLVGGLLTRLLLKKFPIKQLIKVGSSILILSLALAMRVTDLNYFLLGRCLTGMAETIIQTAINGFLAYEGDKEKRNKLFAEIAKGRMKGILCGLILGALLYENLSRTTIYSISCLIAVVLYVSIQVAIEPTAIILRQPKNHEKNFTLKKGMLVLLYSLLVIIPSTFFVNFLYYYVPTYLWYIEKIKVDFYDIRNIFLAYGVGVWVGSSFLECILRGKVKDSYLVKLVIALLGIGFMVFSEVIKIYNGVLWPIIGMTVVIALLNNIGEKAQGRSFNALLNRDRTLSVEYNESFNNIKRLGLAVAPIIFSLGFNDKVFTYISRANIVGVIGVINLGLLMVHTVCTAWGSHQTNCKRREEGS